MTLRVGSQSTLKSVYRRSRGTSIVPQMSLLRKDKVVRESAIGKRLEVYFKERRVIVMERFFKSVELESCKTKEFELHNIKCSICHFWTFEAQRYIF